jgi:hypothetical protein
MHSLLEILSAAFIGLTVSSRSSLSLSKYLPGISGVLLTMSSASGVNYLDKNLGEYLNYSKDGRIESEEASVIGFLLKRFAKSGTRTWHQPTVEWFLVYLLTELAATPHTIRQGRNASSLISAYQQVVQDLVSDVVNLW